MQGLGLLLLIAIAVIYMCSASSTKLHPPLTILSALPFAGFGALLTLLVFKVDLSIYAFVGIIMLVGLVKKNGIMMVDSRSKRRSRKELRRRHLRGVRRSFPADHDDDDGRAHGHDPDRARLRCGRRITPSARTGRRRWTPLLAKR